MASLPRVPLPQGIAGITSFSGQPLTIIHVWHVVSALKKQKAVSSELLLLVGVFILYVRQSGWPILGFGGLCLQNTTFDN